MLRALVLAAAAALSGNPLTVTNGQLILPPPGVPMAAAYLTVENPTDKPETVVGVKVDGAGQAMMHESTLSNGVARMVMLKSLDVPAHGKVTLAPGEKHLMVSFKTPPKRGADLGVTLRLSDGRTAHGLLKVVGARD